MLKLLMISCKEATLLSVKKAYGNTKARFSFKLFLHNLMCKPCKTFLNQVVMIKNSIKSYTQQDRAKLSEAKRVELEKLIQHHLKSNNE